MAANLLHITSVFRKFGAEENILVTNQFQLDGLKQPIYPDIVIFVNGIPLVLIECKSPYIKDPIQEAVEKPFPAAQLLSN
jgi:hypothetical protein